MDSGRMPHLPGRRLAPRRKTAVPFARNVSNGTLQMQTQRRPLRRVASLFVTAGGLFHSNISNPMGLDAGGVDGVVAETMHARREVERGTQLVGAAIADALYAIHPEFHKDSRVLTGSIREDVDRRSGYVPRT